jgi:hypothetical protein
MNWKVMMNPLERLLVQLDEQLVEKREEHRQVTDELESLERQHRTTMELLGRWHG